MTYRQARAFAWQVGWHPFVLALVYALALGVGSC